MISTVASVENVEELRTVTDLKGVVIVRGFYSIGDGGGGNFMWDPESSDDDNNGTIFKPHESINKTGRWIRQFFEEINVRWFGTKGDTKGIAGDYKGTVSVSSTTGTLITEKPVFGPEDKNKIIAIWDSNGVEKPLASPPIPYVTIINRLVNEYKVEFTVELNNPPVRKIDNVCFVWGTNDTDAIQAAWDATKGIYRLIFPNGIYFVGFSKKNKFGLTSNSMPSAYLEGIGRVTIVSPNSLGKIVPGYAEDINEIINFDEFCGRACITNIKFQGISTLDAGIVKYSDGTSTSLPSRFNPAGQWEPYNHRAGIHYLGKDAIICKNVEVSNMPYAGLIIDKGIGQSLIEGSHFHGNGLYNIHAVPGIRTYSKVSQGRTGIEVTQGGSIKLIHTKIENSIPVSWGYISYGIDMGGCDFTAIDCNFVSNTGCGVGNNDANPSTMTFDNCRFAFGKHNEKILFPMKYSNAGIILGTNIVKLTPFPKTFQKQGGYGISIPDVYWSEPKVFPRGTDPPKITITGTAKKPLILKIICTMPGERGSWKFKYSTNNGVNYIDDVASAETIPINSSVDLSPTGLVLNIEEYKDKAKGKKFKATIGDLWTADNTYSFFDPNKVDAVTSSITTRQKADTSSKLDNKSLTWVQTSGSILIAVDATCQNFSCTNSFFKGANATTRQISALLIKGHEYDFDTYKKVWNVSKVNVLLK